MATPSSTSADVELYLDCAWRMIDDVPELAGEWDDLPDAERASWSLDWDQVVLDDMRRLDREYRGGGMSRVQEASYQRLLHRFADLLPVLSRLGLSIPRVSLEPWLESDCQQPEGERALPE